MNSISTHILDISSGKPAAGVPVTLSRRDGDDWRKVGGGETDDDGRLKSLNDNEPLAPGEYRIFFDTGAYFKTTGSDGFYPAVTVIFSVRDEAQHYHVPLLLSPFGYSTYRGS
jgi:5-hydroxyisourate hydrolase